MFSCSLLPSAGNLDRPWQAHCPAWGKSSASWLWS